MYMNDPGGGGGGGQYWVGGFLGVGGGSDGGGRAGGGGHGDGGGGELGKHAEHLSSAVAGTARTAITRNKSTSSRALRRRILICILRTSCRESDIQDAIFCGCAP